MILRRLLACLALLTGLAAIGSPANATVADAMASQVGVSRSAAGTPAAERCECDAQRGTVSGKREPSRQCRNRRSVVITIPTIQFGADRALE